MAESFDQTLYSGNENVVVEENLSYRKLEMLNNSIIQNLEKKFTVVIKVKRKQKVISIKGIESAVEKVKAALLTQPINVFENETKSIFLVGMADEDELVIEQLSGSTEIKSYKASLGNEVTFQNIPDLKDRLLMTFNKSKSGMMDSDTCVVSTEVSKMQFKKPGVYRSKFLLKAPDSIYVRSFPNDYLRKLIPDYDLIHEEPIRHDLHIKIGDTGQIVTYRMYLIGKKGHGFNFGEFEDNDEEYPKIKVGPGYILFPVKESTYFRIINPGKERLLKVFITVYFGAICEYKGFIQKQGEYLRNFFQQIHLRDNDIFIPQLPRGYSVVKYHVSQKVIFPLDNGNELCIEECQRKDRQFTNEHAKPPFTRLTHVNKELNDKLKEAVWNKEKLLSLVEESLIELDQYLKLEE